MDLQLTGHVAIVTGAASGIGRAIALEFARCGCSLLLLDRDAAIEQQVTDITHTCSVRALSLVLDVSNENELRQAAAFAQEEFGRCDHLVCAAGVGSGKYGFPFWNLSPSDWQPVFEVNLMGVVNAAHAFAPAMLEAGSGTMLFLSSVAGQIGSQTDPPYSAAKAAVINFTQCAAKDLAVHNVRVNAICPGMIKTPLNRSVWQAWNNRQSEDDQQSYEEWAAGKIESVVPLNRWQELEDIASMTVFLASERAKNITGQTINVDGGQVMHW